MKRTRTLANLIAPATSILVLGCTGTIGGGGPGPTTDGEDGESTAGPANIDDRPVVDVENPDPPARPEVPTVGGAPLGRLSPHEMRNTLADLFGPEVLDGFDVADGVEGSVRTPIVAFEGATQFQHAETLADKVSRTPRVLICKPASASVADRRACTETIVRDLGLRVFRRPLSEAEFSRHVQAAMQAGTFEDGISTVVFAMLASPKFLYHAFRGDPDLRQGNVQPLTDYEMASRLSYSLWQTMPTRELFDAAADHRLSNFEDIQERARTMLQDPRARDTVRRFHNWWLHLEEANSVVRDQATYPDWKDGIVKSWIAETMTFAEHVTFDDGGTLRALFTAPYSFVDPGAAPVYGVATGQNLARVDLPVTERAGILTQSALLATRAPDERVAPIYRGAFISRNILCTPLPPPPAEIPPLPEPDPDASLRAQISQSTDSAGCRVCHGTFNDMGFALGNYDAMGRHKDRDDNGKDVDARVTLAGHGDLDGIEVNGAVEMAVVFSNSRAVRDCYVDAWYRYLLGREMDPSLDAYSQLHTQFEFESHDRGITEMLVALVGSDAFRHVPAAE